MCSRVSIDTSSSKDNRKHIYCTTNLSTSIPVIFSCILVSVCLGALRSFIFNPGNNIIIAVFTLTCLCISSLLITLVPCTIGGRLIQLTAVVTRYADHIDGQLMAPVCVCLPQDNNFLKITFGLDIWQISSQLSYLGQVTSRSQVKLHR